MTMDHAALLEVLEAMKSAGVNERVKTAAQTMYQALIEAEATAVIGAGPWEHSPDRTAHRNGYRPRVFSTAAGDLELAIPRPHPVTVTSSTTKPDPIGVNPWRAGCSGTGTSGSAGGLGKRIGHKTDTAPQADPTLSGPTGK